MFVPFGRGGEAAVAQPAEHLLGKEEAMGSIPICSSRTGNGVRAAEPGGRKGRGQAEEVGINSGLGVGGVANPARSLEPRRQSERRQT